MALAVTTMPGKIAIAFGEAYGVVMKDPVVFALALDFLTMCTGWTMDHCGGWIRKWGERRATRPMVSGGEAAHVTVIAQSTTTVSASTTVGGG